MLIDCDWLVDLMKARHICELLKWTPVCSFNQMIEDLLRKFAVENFGKGHYPLPHGCHVAAKPLGLMVKTSRSVFWRPLKKNQLTIVGGLEEYVPLDEKNKFLDTSKLHIKKDNNLVLAGHDEDGKGAGHGR